MNLTPKVLSKFLPRVDRSGGDGACWPWTGQVISKHGPNRYGRLNVDGRLVLAHRLAVAFATDRFPSDTEVVMHSCDNPICVNPAHLSVGSQAENVADRTAKRRTARGERFKPSKLRDGDVISIRDALAKGGATQKEIGRRFGVSYGTIQAIQYGRTWLHVDGGAK